MDIYVDMIGGLSEVVELPPKESKAVPHLVLLKLAGKQPFLSGRLVLTEWGTCEAFWRMLYFTFFNEVL